MAYFVVAGFLFMMGGSAALMNGELIISSLLCAWGVSLMSIYLAYCRENKLLPVVVNLKGMEVLCLVFLMSFIKLIVVSAAVNFIMSMACMLLVALYISGMKLLKEFI